jgi:hypothetical protein
LADNLASQREATRHVTDHPGSLSTSQRNLYRAHYGHCSGSLKLGGNCYRLIDRDFSAGAAHDRSFLEHEHQSSVVGYSAYGSTSQGGPYLLVASVIPGSPYNDASGQSGITYYYVVTATDDTSHESAYSNQVKAIVP